MTATLGWAAAAATARLRYGRQAVTTPAAAPAVGPLAGPAAGTASAGTRQRRSWYVLVLCAALVASVFLVLLVFLSSR
jgi:hypothetical protein